LKKIKLEKMSEGFVKPIRPAEITQPKHIVERINDSLSRCYNPLKGYVELNWSPATDKPVYDELLFKWISQVYGGYGWIVTAIPPPAKASLGDDWVLRFEPHTSAPKAAPPLPDHLKGAI
jgi:hypothetical protein